MRHGKSCYRTESYLVGATASYAGGRGFEPHQRRHLKAHEIRLHRVYHFARHRPSNVDQPHHATDPATYKGAGWLVCACVVFGTDSLPLVAERSP